MRRPLILLLLSATHATACQAVRPNTGTALPTPADAIRAIRHIEEVEWARASRTKDSVWFDRHLADELVMTTGRTGRVTSKMQEMADLLAPRSGAAGDTPPDQVDDLQVQVHGPVAVATFRLVTSGVDSTGRYHRVARYTEVWVYRDRRWQLTASHSSLIPAARD